MPLHMRLPKRGFNKPNRAEYSRVNTGALQRAVDARRLDAGKPVDMAALQAAGLVTQPKDGASVSPAGRTEGKARSACFRRHEIRPGRSRSSRRFRYASREEGGCKKPEPPELCKAGPERLHPDQMWRPARPGSRIEDCAGNRPPDRMRQWRQPPTPLPRT